MTSGRQRRQCWPHMLDNWTGIDRVCSTTGLHVMEAQLFDLFRRHGHCRRLLNRQCLAFPMRFVKRRVI